MDKAMDKVLNWYYTFLWIPNTLLVMLSMSIDLVRINPSIPCHTLHGFGVRHELSNVQLWPIVYSLRLLILGQWWDWRRKAMLPLTDYSTFLGEIFLIPMNGMVNGYSFLVLLMISDKYLLDTLLKNIMLPFNIFS